MPTSPIVAALTQEPVDRRCELCGDDRDTYYARVTEHHWRTQCYAGTACTARQNAEAKWSERFTITAEGRAALQAALRRAVA